jgi:hypothetical protein
MLTFEKPAARFSVMGVSEDKIQWTGTPAQGFKLSKADVFLIPFSLMWGGFAIVWETLVVAGSAPIFMRLWGIPFVLVGLYLIVGRFFWDAYVRAHTFYALTDDTALLMRAGLGAAMTTVYLPSVNNMSLRLFPDGSGSIYFGAEPQFWQEAGWFGNNSGPSSPVFRFVSNASAVYEKCKTGQRFGQLSRT